MEYAICKLCISGHMESVQYLLCFFFCELSFVLSCKATEWTVSKTNFPSGTIKYISKFGNSSSHFF